MDGGRTSLDPGCREQHRYGAVPRLYRRYACGRAATAGLSDAELLYWIWADLEQPQPVHLPDDLCGHHREIADLGICLLLLGAVVSIGSIWWSMRGVKEIPPSDEELAKMKADDSGVLGPLKEIFSAIGEMPKVMWQLALVYVFQWYALFCYWQNSSKSIALSVWNATPSSDPENYERAVSWTGLVNGWYNVVTFLTAFILVGFAKKHGAKAVHTGALLLAAAGFLAFPHIGNKNLLFFAITGFGIGWASMMGIPYLLVVNSIPKERYGVYMGVINMMIVVPMIIQNLSFGYILKNFLDNDPGRPSPLQACYYSWQHCSP